MNFYSGKHYNIDLSNGKFIKLYSERVIPFQAILSAVSHYISYPETYVKDSDTFSPYHPGTEHTVSGDGEAS